LWKATQKCLFAGRLLDDERIYRTGVRKLEQFAKLLSRRGVSSEFNSPSYTPIHAYALAEIAAWLQDESTSFLALQLEVRTWVDLLGHYHPTTFQHAGPYSRAYMTDSAGQLNANRYALLALFGELLERDYPDTSFRYESLTLGQRLSAALRLTAEYHCPVGLAETLLRKSYPFTFRAVFDGSPSTDATDLWPR
jgi:hypothetical protein